MDAIMITFYHFYYNSIASGLIFDSIEFVCRIIVLILKSYRLLQLNYTIYAKLHDLQTLFQKALLQTSFGHYLT